MPFNCCRKAGQVAWGGAAARAVANQEAAWALARALAARKRSMSAGHAAAKISWRFRSEGTAVNAGTWAREAASLLQGAKGSMGGSCCKRKAVNSAS